VSFGCVFRAFIEDPLSFGITLETFTFSISWSSFVCPDCAGYSVLSPPLLYHVGGGYRCMIHPTTYPRPFDTGWLCLLFSLHGGVCFSSQHARPFGGIELPWAAMVPLTRSSRLCFVIFINRKTYTGNKVLPTRDCLIIINNRSGTLLTTNAREVSAARLSRPYSPDEYRYEYENYSSKTIKFRIVRRLVVARTDQLIAPVRPGDIFNKTTSGVVTIRYKEMTKAPSAFLKTIE
jgi:hypothetical protein